ncbi:glycosyltransferase family 1 protein [Sphingobium lactosutens]|nr:glycosyltransferase family 1 protein [Sphingobium lactosutens]
MDLAVREAHRKSFWGLRNIFPALAKGAVRHDARHSDGYALSTIGVASHPADGSADLHSKYSDFQRIHEQLARIASQISQIEYRLDGEGQDACSEILGRGDRYIFNLSTSNHWRIHAVGIVRVERELARYLLRYKNVDFILWDGASRSFRRLERYQVRLILSDRWQDGGSGLASFVPATLQPLTPEAGDTYISVGLDWDHAPTPDVMAYLGRHSVKAILACHDTVPARFPEFMVRESLPQEFKQHLVAMGHGAFKIWANSKASKRDLERFWADAKLECELPDIFTVPLASYASGALPMLTAAEQNVLGEVFRKGEYVLYVSSVEPRKNHRLILDIWRDLWRERGEDCPQFVLVGMAGWGSHDLLNRIPRMPVFTGGKVNLLKNVSDNLLAHLYHNCAFTVFPSLYEGWGLAASESMASGRVCIVADNSALPEVTQQLMPAYHPLDFIGWKKEIEKLIDDVPYRKDLESKIAEEYESMSWDDFGKQFCENIEADISYVR